MGLMATLMWHRLHSSAAAVKSRLMLTFMKGTYQACDDTYVYETQGDKSAHVARTANDWQTRLLQVVSNWSAA